MAEPQVDWRRQVERLVSEGDRHAHLAENSEALASYIEALDLIPEPRDQHQQTDRVTQGLRKVLEARGDLGDGIELLMGTKPGLGSMLARLTGRGDWVG